MSRAAVLQLLRNDSTLAGLGGSGFVVMAQYSADQRPNGDAGFMVVVWRTTDFAVEIQDNGPRHFDLYAHWSIGKSTDFGRIDAMLDQADVIFKAVPDAGPIAAGDGLQLDYIGFNGRSIDIADSGYGTICRYASYMALSSTVSA